jgi:hypothetical protein
VLAQLTATFSIAQAPRLNGGSALAFRGGLMKSVRIITFGLASLLASPISAQTPDGAATQKSSQLPPVKVEAPRAVTLTAPATGSGSGLTPGYVANDARKFGSREWWIGLENDIRH